MRADAAGGKRVRRDPRRILLTVLAVLILLNAGVLIARILRGRAPEAEGVTVPDYVTEDLLPKNRWSRSGAALKTIDGVVIHYVGNPDTSAQANRNYFASLADGKAGTFASSHFIVGLEGEVIQCVPLTEVAYASNNRNSDTVAIEVCHPDETGEFTPAAYARLTELTAWLCRTFAVEPEEQILRHYDVTGKECPRYYVRNPEAWEEFLADVAAEMARAEAP